MQRLIDKVTKPLVVLVFLLTSGCSMAETRLMLCWRLSDGNGQVLHSDPSPSGTAVIYVIKVDCGQSRYSGTIYKCSTRLDLDMRNQWVIHGFEMAGVCDAKIKWLDDDHIEVSWANGEKEELNVWEAFGVLP